MLPFEHKVNKQDTFVATLTPKMCEMILNDLNPNNRPLRKGAAERYALDMKAGSWQLTHHGIAFAKDGNLIDGQHRMFACIEADTPFKTMVTVGLDEAALEAIDVGIRRSDADVYAMRTGEKVSPTYVCTARIMANLTNSRSLTRTAVLAFMERHDSALRFACGLMPSTRKFVAIAQVLAVIARAFYTQDHAQLESFGRMLNTGLPEGDESKWRPAILLRRWLISGHHSSTAERRTDVYFKTETALDAFLTGKKLTRLYAASKELYPLTRLKAS